MYDSDKNSISDIYSKRISPVSLSVFIAVTLLLLLCNPASCRNLENGDFNINENPEMGVFGWNSGSYGWYGDCNFWGWVTQSSNGVGSSLCADYTVFPDYYFNAVLYQSVNLTNAYEIRMKIKSNGVDSCPFNVSVDSVLLKSQVPTTSYEDIVIPISGYDGDHNLSVLCEGRYYPNYHNYLDDVEILYRLPLNASLWAYQNFTFGGSCRYYASVENVNIDDLFSVDIFGLDNDSYDLLNTINFTSSNGAGSYPVDFTAPSQASGYYEIYGVLKKSDNTELSNSSDLLYPAGESYLFFSPPIVGQNESTVLYYKNGYSDRTKIVDDYSLVRGVLTSKFSVRQFINSGDSGTLGYNEYPSSVDKSGVYGSGLYEGDTTERTSRLLWDTYTVDGDYQHPDTPRYDPEDNIIPPEDNESDNGNEYPDLPDDKELPDFPVDPVIPDNGSYEGGNFPVDNVSNQTVNTSRFQGFYTFVDGVYSPLNETVNGFLGFVLHPVKSLTGYVSQTKEYFDNSTSGLINNNLVVECLVPVFQNLPPVIIQLILFSLVLTLIGLLLRGV